MIISDCVHRLEKAFDPSGFGERRFARDIRDPLGAGQSQNPEFDQ
jgi:hypothetical protein